jgi:hypothetical protein
MSLSPSEVRRISELLELVDTSNECRHGHMWWDNAKQPECRCWEGYGTRFPFPEPDRKDQDNAASG